MGRHRAPTTHPIVSAVPAVAVLSVATAVAFAPTTAHANIPFEEPPTNGDTNPIDVSGLRAATAAPVADQNGTECKSFFTTRLVNQHLQDVRTIQTALSWNKYETGPIDGQYGPITSGAVTRFQMDRRIEVDGVVGPETWGALGLTGWCGPPTAALQGSPPPPPGVVTARGIISDAQIAQVARNAGLDGCGGLSLGGWVAIALAESGGNTNAHNTSGEDSRGLWQINMRAHASWVGNNNLFDPNYNAVAAKHVCDSQGPRAWSVYSNGLYQRFLSRGNAAASSGGVAQASVQAPAPAPANVSSGAQAAIAFAKAQLGDRYVFGATGPDAWDCSGLVQAAARAGGVSLPRTTFSQINSGYAVSVNNLLPGDLVFANGVNHVGMYIGNGQIIHAPNSRSVVKISPLNNGYNYASNGARRIF
jgi:cell wall-associated NlpC family hydrolase